MCTWWELNSPNWFSRHWDNLPSHRGRRLWSQPNTGFYEMRKCFSVEILFHPGHHRIWLKPIYFLTLQDISFTISILAFRPLGRFGSNYSCYRVLLYMINIVCLAVHWVLYSHATKAPPISTPTMSVEAHILHLHPPLLASKAVLGSWSLVAVCALITRDIFQAQLELQAGSRYQALCTRAQHTCTRIYCMYRYQVHL